LDGDGVISKSEIENASKSLLKLDQNQDGQLTSEETRPANRGAAGRPGQALGLGNGAQGGRPGNQPQGRQGAPGNRGNMRPAQGRPGQGRNLGQGRPGGPSGQAGQPNGPGRSGGQNRQGGAQAGGGQPGGRDPRRDAEEFAQRVKALDSNSDGMIALSEIPEHMHAALKKHDANGDEKLDNDELLNFANEFRRDRLRPEEEPQPKEPK
ncbi:MAG: hypothetical protein AAF483_05330, partial [Planctomycetota bacterium]